MADDVPQGDLGVVEEPADLAGALETLAPLVADGQCVLFLGSGVHREPPKGSSYTYDHQHRPKSAAELSAILEAHPDVQKVIPDRDKGDLKRSSLWYKNEVGPNQLAQAVEENVQTGKRPSPLLDLLAQLDFRVVITTNYDRLFEEALRAHGKDPRVIIYNLKPDAAQTAGSPTTRRPWLLKLHGDIDNPDTMVITDEDYIDFVLNMTLSNERDPIPLPFRYHLSVWNTLVIGYSLLDYNFRALLKALRFDKGLMSVKQAFSVDPDPDDLIVKVWHGQLQYVKFFMVNGWQFVPALREAVEAIKSSKASADLPGREG